MLRYASQPAVRPLAGDVASSYDASTGDLRLTYRHQELTEVRIGGGRRSPLTLLLADRSTVDTFGRVDSTAGPVLVRGPALVRRADVRGSVLALTVDTTAPADLEVWGKLIVPPEGRQGACRKFVS